MTAIDREIQACQLQLAKLRWSDKTTEEKAIESAYLRKQIQELIELAEINEHGWDQPEDEVERVISFSEEIWNKRY